jgi:uncharacterized protein involved in cysteine biosynthesis
MRSFLEAFRLIAGTPRLWRYIVQPLLVSALIFVAVVLLGYFLLVPPIASLIASWGVPLGASNFVGIVVYAIAWFFVAGIVFISLVTLTSSFLWDRLSLEVEEQVMGYAPNRTPPTPVVLLDSVKRMLMNLSLGLVSLCANVIPVAGPVAVSGFVGTLDYTANAYLRRNVLLGSQMRMVYRNPDAASFHVLSGIVTLIPFVNLVLLPVMVAAGTIMVARGEARIGMMPIDNEAKPDALRA